MYRRCSRTYNKPGCLLNEKRRDFVVTSLCESCCVGTRTTERAFQSGAFSMVNSSIELPSVGFSLLNCIFFKTAQEAVLSTIFFVVLIGLYYCQYIIYPIPDNEKYSTFGFYLFSRHPVVNGTRTQ